MDSYRTSRKNNHRMQPTQKTEPVKALQPHEAALLCAIDLPVTLCLAMTEDGLEICSLARGLGLNPWDREIVRALGFADLVLTLDSATVRTGQYDGTARYPTRVARLKRVIRAAVELVKERMNR